MPRRNRKAGIRQAVETYIAEAEFQRPEQAPLDVKFVANKLKVSRTTLYEYGLNEDLKQAAQRQLEHAREADLPPHKRSLEIQFQLARDALKDVEARNRSLLAQMAIIEANAVRLGINPEELYKPLLKPIHTVSRAGTRSKQPNRRSV
jgi:hypothetical protein